MKIQFKLVPKLIVMGIILYASLNQCAVEESWAAWPQQESVLQEQGMLTIESIPVNIDAFYGNFQINLYSLSPEAQQKIMQSSIISQPPQAGPSGAKVFQNVIIGYPPYKLEFTFEDKTETYEHKIHPFKTYNWKIQNITPNSEFIIMPKIRQNPGQPEPYMPIVLFKESKNSDVKVLEPELDVKVTKEELKIAAIPIEVDIFYAGMPQVSLYSLSDEANETLMRATQTVRRPEAGMFGTIVFENAVLGYPPYYLEFKYLSKTYKWKIPNLTSTSQLKIMQSKGKDRSDFFKPDLYFIERTGDPERLLPLE